MADLQNLELNEDEVELAAELPEERALRLPMLQPGVGFVFQLPATFDFEAFQIDAGQRVMAKFRDDKVLKVYGAGTPVRTTVSNMEQDRKNKEGQKVKVNAFAYLLRALGFTGELKKNRDYVNALVAYASDYFGADWGWNARCNPKNDIWRNGAAVKGRTGCGQKYGDRTRTYTVANGPEKGKTKTILQIPRNGDGSWQEVFKCQGKRGDGSPCDADIFCNGELSNFKAVQKEEAPQQ